MIRAKDSIHINAPCHLVFVTAASPHKQLYWDRGFNHLEILLPGNEGARYSCFMRWMGTQLYEMVEFKAYSRFAHKTIGTNSRGYHLLEFTPQEDETTWVTQTMVLQPRGPGYLLYPLLPLLLKTKLSSLNKGLKNYLENGSEFEFDY